MEKNYTVGFFIQTPFHYFLYESIIDELVNRNIKCHLLISDSTQNGEDWKSMYQGLINFVEDLDRDDIDAFYIETVKNEGFMYECVISPFYTPSLKGLGKKNIRVMYSLAKEEWIYSWWNIFYDKILCYGNYDFNKLNIFNNCIKVGNAKFDKWFKGSLPNKEKIINEYDLLLNNQKTTILYAPTYGQMSSMEEWLYEVRKLETQYNLIIKIHHGTSYLKEEEKRKEYIKKNFKNVVDDTSDLLRLLKISDLVVTDYSGIIFDALLAKKKILLLNSKSIQEKSNESSLEIRIRKELLNIYKDTDILNTIINMNFKIDNNLMEIREELFSYTDGYAGVRAVKVILSEIKNEKNNNELLLNVRQQLLLD